jgi:hypothetical protein
VYVSAYAGGANVPLSELPFATSISQITGWPSDRNELVDFLCQSLGLWEEAERLKRDDPKLIRQLNQMAEQCRPKEYDPMRESTGVDLRERAAQAAKHLGEGVSLEEVCALMGLDPGEVVDALGHRNGVARPGVLRGLPSSDLFEFDMDCRLAVLGKTAVARKYGLTRMVVHKWCVRCNLNDGRHLKFRTRGTAQPE